MADTRRHVLDTPLNIEQILREARHRWLRPAEICEILQNYKRFQIAPEPANMPKSGSLFLFDRKVLRYFRKDGHNWRKKKDGKTVKEAHERLKAGSVDVLHCYYAHGEHNESFQRRTYWMLEEELSHIVLVHYLEVKGNKMSIHRIKETEDTICYSSGTEEALANHELDSSLSSDFQQNNYPVPSQMTDCSSGPQASEYEDAESVYKNKCSRRLQSSIDFQETGIPNMDARPCDPYYPALNADGDHKNLSVIPAVDVLSLSSVDINKDRNGAGLTLEQQKHLDFSSWAQVFEYCTSGSQSNLIQPSVSTTEPGPPPTLLKHSHDMLGQLLTDSCSKKQEIGIQLQCQEELQEPVTDENADKSRAENGDFTNSYLGSNVTSEVKVGLSSASKPVFSNILAEECLKKNDSFNRWMSNQLGDVNALLGDSSTSTYWGAVVDDNDIDSTDPAQEHENVFMLTPSLSQEQLFTIIDFSPGWTYAGSIIKVLISGRFLKNREEVEICKWSCMFGEVEVPADVVTDGVLRCHAPVHKAGRVPFYVTCSNRLACSEIREFEFRVNNSQDVNSINSNDYSMSETLHTRFAKLLCVNSSHPSYSIISRKSPVGSKICSLLKEDCVGWDHVLNTSDELSPEKMREELFQKLLKEKLCEWLIQKTVDGGKGASILDEGGQGVLHFASALAYDWALQPTIVAGVNVNFRDVNGWTALHWAAYCGRERTVASLIALGAAPGAVTDPTPAYPTGRTPADLASAAGHKGIAGYLAESSLSAHLESLNLNNAEGNASSSFDGKAVQTVSMRSPTPDREEDFPGGLSLKDSLAAVCNATQAAARIHEVFRVQSFQRKQLKEYGDDKCTISGGHALPLAAIKADKTRPADEPFHAAAIRIQNKFRGWKGRKDFLVTRQQIVKIQAHFRGHQVRKNYKRIVWSVGILEKVILRWRRKGSGLRGFKPEALSQTSTLEDASSKDDEYDFLKDGRKQSKERLEKALARVKSMVNYPEARDQYRRLLNVVTEIRGSQVESETIPGKNVEPTDFDDDLMDLEELLGEDMLMPMAT